MTQGEQATSVSAPIAKAATSTAAAASVWGINNWADVAAVVAALYSLCLLCEWVWRRIIRPYCEYRGWIARRKRRVEDF